MANLSKAFGLEIRRAREEIGLSQEKLAEAAGVHRTYISRLELAKMSPTIDMADKIANALKIKLSELISRAEK